MTLAAGKHLGRYEVRAPIGAGGMGEVWLAYDHDLDREVAIKVLRFGATDPDRIRRFIQEAKAASALNHPNVATVYEIGTQDDLRYIAMEIIAGETLRDRIARGALAVDDALDIALQITAALAAAHSHGIIHRDIKPENIIIRPDGYAKVLDFGLAKLHEPRDSATIVKTATGIAMGTIGYMAPEQFTSSAVTAAADVYSLGVVLYEMLSGHRPESGTPRSLDIPPKLNAVIAKALAKDPRERYPSAVEMLEDLRSISREQRAPAVAKSAAAPLKWIGAFVVLVIIAAAVWMFVRSARTKEAAALILKAQQMSAQRRFPEAYDATMRAAAIVPNDEHLPDLITALTQKVSIQTDPPGAAVFLQRFRGPDVRVRAGTTPLELPRLMRADYLVTVEKPGYATATRPLSIAPIWARDAELEAPRMPGTLQIKMIEAAKVPPKMVFVSGGPYRLQGWDRPSDREIDVPGFFIDRYEVSNRDFDEFVRAGGYRRSEFWKSLPIPFEAAMAQFRDTTALPGPRSWVGGAPPVGRENYPVTDVTWYEAEAFAEWGGKQLPTIYQWEKAGRYPGTRGLLTTFPWGFVASGVDVTERANFLGKGTVPVDSMPFGMSAWGAHHMAGNVSEWVRNEKPPGHIARGGSWNDATYAFGQSASFPAMYSSPTLGFRCVKAIAPGEDGGFAMTGTGFVPTFHAVDDRTFEELRKQYDYVRTPLKPRIVETKELPDWKREKIAFDVAGKTVIAYLYSPHGFKPPYQVIYFAPAGDVESGLRSLTASIEAKMVAHVRTGRAMFAVAMEGYIDRPRPAPYEPPDPRTREYVDEVVAHVTELRRGLDYLETRPDIDPRRIAFEADSAGVWAGIILCAVENRFRSILYVGSGLQQSEATDASAANRINFVPHIRTPKLMLQGRYDESTPYASEFEPMFKLMPQPKRVIVYEGPHVPPLALYLRESQKWFDETLGKVGR